MRRMEVRRAGLLKVAVAQIGTPQLALALLLGKWRVQRLKGLHIGPGAPRGRAIACGSPRGPQGCTPNPEEP